MDIPSKTLLFGSNVFPPCIASKNVNLAILICVQLLDKGNAVGSAVAIQW